jgi:hypothetical protein
VTRSPSGRVGAFSLNAPCEHAEEAKAMSIENNLKKTAAAIALDILNGGDLASRVGTAAMSAMMNGMHSEEWREYMALFCDTKDELAQLSVVRDTDGSYMPQMRAYIVANAICTGSTGTRTGNRVDEIVEPPPGAVVPQDIEDPTQIRPFAIVLP